MSDTTPRRIRMDQWTPAERAIYDAVQIVETMGADVRLTEAVILLGQARDKVADFVDRRASSPSPDAGSEPRMRYFRTRPPEPDMPVSSPASERRGEPMTEDAHDAKLRLDAEAVLTWEYQKGSDPLAFGHLTRFAKEILRLLDGRSTGEPSPDLAALPGFTDLMERIREYGQAVSRADQGEPGAHVERREAFVALGKHIATLQAEQERAARVVDAAREVVLAYDKGGSALPNPSRTIESLRASLRGEPTTTETSDG